MITRQSRRSSGVAKHSICELISSFPNPDDEKVELKACVVCIMMPGPILPSYTSSRSYTTISIA